MNGWMVAMMAAAGIGGLAVVTAAVRRGRAIGTLLSGAGQGWLSMLALTVTAGFTGVSIGWNAMTVSIAGVLGLPGVIGMLIARLFLPA